MRAPAIAVLITGAILALTPLAIAQDRDRDGRFYERDERGSRDRYYESDARGSRDREANEQSREWRERERDLPGRQHAEYSHIERQIVDLAHEQQHTRDSHRREEIERQIHQLRAEQGQILGLRYRP
jgi:hypothetical protein